MGIKRGILWGRMLRCHPIKVVKCMENKMEPLSVITGTTKTLSALASLYKGCVAVNSRFLVKKIEKFSEKPFDEDVVRNFVNGMDANRWEEIQDLIIHQLTQAESVIKAIYERNLVEALLTRKISDAEFWKMNFVLQHLYTFDISELKQFYNDGYCSEENKKVFLFYGLLKDAGNLSVEDGAAVIGQLYEKSEFGNKFVEAIKDREQG